MLSAKLTGDLLASIRLNTGYAAVDAVIESVIHLYRPEIEMLMSQRDAALTAFEGANKLNDDRLELLYELPIDIDEKLTCLDLTSSRVDV